jgi:hypothetical protein
MRRALALLSVLLSLALAGPVAADAVYHTERLTLAPVGDAAGTGFVVNIHPNGPLHFAQERYALRGAEAGATYSVFLIVDASALDCPFPGLEILMKAILSTNAAGNATAPADFFFTPEGIPPCLRNASFPIHWDVTLDGVLTHQTIATMVTLD